MHMHDHTDRLAAIVSTVQRRWGPSALQRAAPPRAAPRTLATGIAPLDGWLPGGGLPRGALSEACGTPTCGLTTLALSATARTQRDGGRPLWLDLGATFDPYAAERQGVALDTLVLVRPRDAQEALALLDDLIGGRAARLIVVSGAERLARELAPTVLDAAFRRLAHAAQRQGRTALCLSALPPERAPRPLLPHCTLCLHLRGVAWLREEHAVAGYRVEARLLRAAGSAQRPPIRFPLHP